MSESASIEELRAFARTKPTEFDGFLVAYRKTLPKVLPEGDVYYKPEPEKKTEVIKSVIDYLGSRKSGSAGGEG